MTPQGHEHILFASKAIYTLRPGVGQIKYLRGISPGSAVVGSCEHPAIFQMAFSLTTERRIMNSPPLPPDDFRQALHRLEVINAKLHYYQDQYFDWNREFWATAARLTALAPPPRAPDDEAASFLQLLIERLTRLSTNDHVQSRLLNTLELNTDRADLALSSLAALLDRVLLTPL